MVSYDKVFLIVAINPLSGLRGNANSLIYYWQSPFLASSNDSKYVFRWRKDRMRGT